MPAVTELDSTRSASFPPITVQHVLNCSFSEWHKRFSAITLKSKVLPLPEDFIEYLHKDGLFLPLDSDGLPQPHYEHPDDSDFESDKNEEDDQEWKKEFEHLNAECNEADIGSSDAPDDTEEEQNIPHFPDLERDIAEAVQELGGAVFPKLNWSSPKDASWIALSGTLKCDNAADIFLLLKSSDFVTHDLCQAFEHCCTASPDEELPKRPERFELVLRKWYDLSPSMEFRCFVRDGNLIGISQRDTANYYEFLPELANDFRDLIEHFYDQKLEGKFPDPSFVFDVYINKGNRKVWLLDINPFGPMTDALLFKWEDILTAEVVDPVPIRVIGSQYDASTSVNPTYGLNRLPRDAIDLSNGASIDEFADRFQRELMRSQLSDDEEGR
ncbi:hypothetical protein HDV00_003761 [Rhizophlyctis rosea]|nr:hypothetical protein HDV00_003761 [Rhizophlyctis rosea]